MYTELMSTGVVLLHFVKRFVTLQKKITLVIAKKPFNAHTKPIRIENYCIFLMFICFKLRSLWSTIQGVIVQIIKHS